MVTYLSEITAPFTINDVAAGVHNQFSHFVDVFAHNIPHGVLNYLISENFRMGLTDFLHLSKEAVTNYYRFMFHTFLFYQSVSDTI